MSVTLRNNKSMIVDVPGEGLIFNAGQSKTRDFITEPLAEAIQAGDIEVTAQTCQVKVVPTAPGQTEFDLPFNWPGPNHVALSVGGLTQEFGVDWTVDAENNILEWLDTTVTLDTTDVLVLTGRWAS